VTDVELREYVDLRFAELERVSIERMGRFQAMIEASRRELQLTQAAADKAVAKAEAAAERRFESVNEFRGQLSDQAASFMPREVADTRLSKLESLTSKLVGGLGVVMAIGLANFVRLWTG
jgi:hypothetical protein